MNEFLLYLDGLGQHRWVAAKNLNAAKRKLLDSLTDDEKSRLVLIDCHDVERCAPSTMKATQHVKHNFWHWLTAHTPKFGSM